MPNQSVYNKVSSDAAAPTADAHQSDLSWQLTLQRVWQNLIQSEQGLSYYVLDFLLVYCRPSDSFLRNVHSSLANFEVNSLTISDPGDTSEYGSSLVFPSLPLAIKWLRESALQNRSTRFQV